MAKRRKSSKGVKSISHIKRQNQRYDKLGRQGKLRPDIKKKVRAKFQQLVKVQPKNGPNKKAEKTEVNLEEMTEMIEADDISFLKEAAKSNRFSMLKGVKEKSDAKKPLKRKATETDVELEYGQQTDIFMEVKELLPIKTAHGIVKRTAELYPESDLRDKEEDDKNEEISSEKEDEEQPELPPLSVTQIFANRQQLLQEKKVMIALLATNFLAQPEGRRYNLQKLLKMLTDDDPAACITVKKLALASLLEIFRDLLPGYKIVHGTEPGQKLKKVEKCVQKFENYILECYRQYLVRLEKMASVLKLTASKKMEENEPIIKLAELSLWCMCELLMEYPNFNYSINIVYVVVSFLNSSNPSAKNICCSALKRVFRRDTKGWISLQAVKRIYHLVKAKKYGVKKDVLDVLLALRIKKLNLEKEKEDEIKRQKFMTHKEKLLHLSRAERKKSKKTEQIQKELMTAQAEENASKKNRYFTEVTSVVFAIYFRTLKSEPKKEIIGSVLEGLAQFAHLINVDFFQDLSAQLNKLLESGELNYRSCIHCLQTIFTILSGQGESFVIDPERFYSHLYQALFQLNAGTSNNDVPSALHSVHAVLSYRRKKVSQQCVLAFTKRLCTLALQLQHNGAIASLTVVKIILMIHKFADILLDSDITSGSGMYLPEIDNPEHCNAGSTALWELHTLCQHYHPVVRRCARNIMLGVPVKGEGCLPAELKKSPEELFEEYDSSSMAFNPPVPPPKKMTPGSKHGRFVLKSREFQKLCDDVLEQDYKQDVDFYEECFL